MEQIPCPDGYLLDAKSQLADGHHAINTYLVRLEEAGWKTAAKELNALRDKRLKMRVWFALLERLEWHREQNPEGPFYRSLHDITYGIEKWKLAPSHAELIDLLGRSAPLARYCLMPHLMAYVSAHGLTRELSAAIRKFGEAVQDGSYVNQVSLQLMNSRLEMLAFRDEWDDIDLSRCWSERIRADFRGMQGAEREHWRKLIHSIDGDEGTRPAPKWLKESEVEIGAIGAAEFRARLLAWFEPLRSGQKQQLTRAGSFLLRSLVWLAETQKDPALESAMAEICGVDFKPRRNGEKVLRSASEAAAKKATPAIGTL